MATDAEFESVTTLSQLEEFLAKVGKFHDGVVKEVHWINGDHVDEELSMRPYQPAHARVLVQRQFKDPSAVELRFYDLGWMRLDARDFVFDSAAKTQDDYL